MMSWCNVWPILAKIVTELNFNLTCLVFVCCKGLLSLALAPGLLGAQSSLEEQAHLLLTEAERQTMTYYIQEYHCGHIGVEPLAMALFELFNTHAKVKSRVNKLDSNSTLPKVLHET